MGLITHTTELKFELKCHTARLSCQLTKPYDEAQSTPYGEAKPLSHEQPAPYGEAYSIPYGEAQFTLPYQLNQGSKSPELRNSRKALRLR